jgi:PKD repeat protein
MRTTSYAARGRPLAALLLLLTVVTMPWAIAAGQSVHVNQTIEWSEELEIIRLGSEPSLADIALHIEGLGPVSGYPVDCLLIIDTSATADLASAKAFAFDLIDRLSDEDRIGLISYATTARLDVPLTHDRTALKTAIADLTGGGKSALGLAMQMARRELHRMGRDDAILVEALLADGQSNTGPEPAVEGEIAADTGIQIVSVGIGNLINRNLLEQFASETGGLFYNRPSEQALLGIDERFKGEIAASEIRVDKRLPEGLQFVSASPSPTQVETLTDGTTSVIWRIAELLVGQQLEIEIQIESLQPGAWWKEADSLLTYADFRGVVGSISIPVAKWPPMANFGYEPAEPTTVDVIEFSDLSEDPDDDGEIIAWEWDFGDGTISLEQNPTHRYAERGEYTVVLSVVDEWGAVSADVATNVIVADPTPPIAIFEYSPIAPTTGDIVAFEDASIHPDEHIGISRWAWDFGDGTVGVGPNPEHRFAEHGTYRVELTVTDIHGTVSEPFWLGITIGNTPPYASFQTRRVGPVDDVDEDILMADRPRVGVEILLDASGSYDLDDSIEWYQWDFDGDGTVDEITETSEVAHRFDEPGEHTVILTAVDTEGALATFERSLDVIATVTTLRTIDTGLPDDWTIPAGVVYVTLSLELNTTLHGLSVTETIPAGWTFTAIESDGATLREVGQTIEWLFLEKFVPDGVNSHREIRYTLTAPETVGEMQQATISGMLGSSSPRITQVIAGDDRVTASSILTVPVVISRWDVATGTIDPFLGETIGFDQIQYAVSLWLSGEAVTSTGDMTITLATMRDLIAYWLTGSSVHDPLP